MKFSDLSLPEHAQDGKDLHLRHPAFGHLLYTGKGANHIGELVGPKKDAQPITVRVRSSDAEVVQNAQRKDMRAGMDGGDSTPENLIDAMIVSWTGLEDEKGEPWPCTRANKIAFVVSQPDFDRQVTAFSRKQSNFFEKRGAD